MPNLGVHVKERATAVSLPVVADSGIPFFVGTAPAHMAAKPARANYPVLCTSWDEAVEKLGFSYDWKKYTLCEAMYSHFQLYGCQPVIFCNVLDPNDPDARKPAESKPCDVAEHRVTLPLETIRDGLKVTSGEGEDAAPLKEDEDYTLFYDESKGCIIELLEDSPAYEVKSLTVEAAQLDPGVVTSADVIMGINQADACMTAVGVIPDLLLAPGYTHDTVVAAILATKAAGINGLFRAKALIDADCSAGGVTEYSQLTAYKAKNNLVDVNQIVCWPQVKLGEYQFHLSTQLAGLMAQVDTANGGCPYESPSNKNLKIDACCLEDGTEINLTWEQVNLVAGSWGVVTAINFIGMGWTAKGNYTACFPGNTDVKDQFIPVSRMFDWVGNTFVRTFWAMLDRPMTRRLIDNILDTGNIWLNGQVASEHLLGARAEMREDENNPLDLMAGIIRIHIYITPPSPAQETEFTLEYDIGYMQSALAA
ncbi:MAG: phage tail protein [Oscillospiraceae bacterium]|nr:phage tail protein [Oscillospiraceae bacterium]